MRRFTPLTNAPSKKPENLEATVVLLFVDYNLVRIHDTLKETPTMVTEVTKELCSIGDLIGKENA